MTATTNYTQELQEAEAVPPDDRTMRQRALVAVRYADWTYHYSDDPKAFRKGQASTSKAINLCDFAHLDYKAVKASLRPGK